MVLDRRTSPSRCSHFGTERKGGRDVRPVEILVPLGGRRVPGKQGFSMNLSDVSCSRSGQISDRARPALRTGEVVATASAHRATRQASVGLWLQGSRQTLEAATGRAVRSSGSVEGSPQGRLRDPVRPARRDVQPAGGPGGFVAGLLRAPAPTPHPLFAASFDRRLGKQVISTALVAGVDGGCSRGLRDRDMWS